ncbi:MAG: hypothetical protein K1X86_07545 [Ignavibacteria bacterium]|nr:hypothetical protein [Ignavibacteria bacterium]
MGKRVLKFSPCEAPASQGSMFYETAFHYETEFRGYFPSQTGFGTENLKLFLNSFPSSGMGKRVLEFSPYEAPAS